MSLPRLTLNLLQVFTPTQKAYALMNPPPNFWEFLRLGIEHIWTGYDHLLFLAGLLIVCGRFRSIIGIVTAFTIAHSISHPSQSPRSHERGSIEGRLWRL